MLVRTLLLFVLFMLVARAVWRLIEAVVRSASGETPGGGARRPGAGPAAVKMAQCPVCGTYVVPGKALAGVSQGQAVYFCSEACRARFAA